MRIASLLILSVCVVPAFACASDNFTALLNIPLTVTGPDAICKIITNASPTEKSMYVPTNSVPEWHSFIAAPPVGVTLASCSTNIIVPAGVNLNLCTLANNPTSGGSYTFVIESGTVVGSSDVGYLALTTGTCWVATSSLTLINEGKIYGKEASAGGTGGGALGVSYPIIIDNTNGSIFAGGGGGGSGGSVSLYPLSGGGGGGGSGQGYGNQAGPSGGSSGSYDSYCDGGNCVSVAGGGGGAGGTWGSAGSSGSDAQSSAPSYSTFSPPSGGGAGGPAVSTMRGATVTWLGGNTAARVKGSTVSVGATQCSDSLDNNSNGRADTSDTCGCVNEFDTAEYCAQCNDGIDNDASGLADMADTCSCSSVTDDGETYDYNLCPFTGSTIICTELHRQGLLPDKWMDADARFGASMPAIVMNGYHLWARPIVALMQRSHAVTMIVNFFAQPWAHEMAHIEGVEERGSFFGLIEMIVGIPLSGLIGIFVTPWW